MLATYPGALGRPLTPLEWVQLWLNLPRQALRRAHEVARGLQEAQSTEPPSWDWADAWAAVEEETAEVHYGIGAVRQDARVKQKRGW